MNQIATITSKMQFTIPMVLARRVGIQSGEKVDIAEKEGQLIITPLRKLVEELAGSVKIPARLRGKDIDEAIRLAKEDYFRSKYAAKRP